MLALHNAAAKRALHGEKTVSRRENARGAEDGEEPASRPARKRGAGDAPHGSRFFSCLLPVLCASAPARETVRDK